MLRDVLLVLGGLAIAGLVPVVILRARALDRRIEEHFAEEGQGAKDPYTQMVELLNAEQAAGKKEKK